MNRRDFFKVGAVAAVATQFPALVVSAEPAAGFVSIDTVRRAVDILRGQRGVWYCIVTPSIERELRGAMTPRERWKLAHRQARMDLNKMFKHDTIRGEIGSVEDVRFIPAR